MASIPDQPRKTFHISTPRDMLRKLEWDIKQLVAISPFTLEHHYQAMNCAVTAWQMGDWVHAALSTGQRAQFASPRKFRDHVRAKCRWLSICRELADAAKHGKLNDDPSPVIGTAQLHIYQTPGGALVMSMPIADDDVEYTPEQVMTGAAEFWREYLDELGLA